MIFTKNTYNDNRLNSLYAPNIFIGWEGTYLSPMGEGAAARWYSNLGDAIYGWLPYNDGNQFIKYGSDAQGAKCAMFTGNDTYVNPGDAVFLRLYRNDTKQTQRDIFGYQQSFSVQMTCTHTIRTNYRGIMGYATAISGRTGILFGQYQNGSVVWGVSPYIGSNDNVFISIPNASVPTTKFNWCFVYDKDFNTTGGQFRLYFNGSLVGSANLTGGSPPFSTDESNVHGVSLAYGYQGTGRHMGGNIYSLLFYNRPLTQGEIVNNWLIDKQKYIF